MPRVSSPGTWDRWSWLSTRRPTVSARTNISWRRMLVQMAKTLVVETQVRNHVCVVSTLVFSYASNSRNSMPSWVGESVSKWVCHTFQVKGEGGGRKGIMFKTRDVANQMGCCLLMITWIGIELGDKCHKDDKVFLYFSQSNSTSSILKVHLVSS